MRQQAQAAETELKWAVWQILTHWGTPCFYHSATQRLTEARTALDKLESAVNDALTENNFVKSHPMEGACPDIGTDT
jgi:hypothetical protein